MSKEGGKGKVKEKRLLSTENPFDPRVSDWQYAALAEDQMERDGSGDDWALSEMADGRTDAECAENVASE